MLQERATKWGNAGLLAMTNCIGRFKMKIVSPCRNQWNEGTCVRSAILSVSPSLPHR